MSYKLYLCTHEKITMKNHQFLGKQKISGPVRVRAVSVAPILSDTVGKLRKLLLFGGDTNPYILLVIYKFYVIGWTDIYVYTCRIKYCIYLYNIGIILIQLRHIGIPTCQLAFSLFLLIQDSAYITRFWRSFWDLFRYSLKTWTRCSRQTLNMSQTGNFEVMILGSP